MSKKQRDIMKDELTKHLGITPTETSHAKNVRTAVFDHDDMEVSDVNDPLIIEAMMRLMYAPPDYVTTSYTIEVTLNEDTTTFMLTINEMVLFHPTMR